MSAVEAYPLVAPGCWAQRVSADNFAGRPALFLDRDGVVVEETGYLGRAEDVRMIEGVATAIGRVNRMGIPVVVVTNQAGVARGYYGWDGFAAVHARIAGHLAEAGAHVDAIMACAYHRDGQGLYRVGDHPWRKPSPGMLEEAGRMLEIDLDGSALVGDAVTDIQAAERAGLSRAALVMTGHGSQQYEEHRQWLEHWSGRSGFSLEIFADAAAAIDVLLEQLTANPRGGL